MNTTKVVIIAEEPESLIEDANRKTILVCPRNKRLSSKILLQKNIKVIFSSYSRFPDIESLKIIRDVLFYLINTSEIEKGEKVEILFKKRGEFHKLLFDTSQLEYVTINSLLSDRLSGKLIESILKLSMNIARLGVEGRPAGALLIVGDPHEVSRYTVRGDINPIEAIPQQRRSILNEDNFGILRQYATMDGATIINQKGEVVSCNTYIKILDIPTNVEEIGGRHLAAKSISKLTKAIAIVVSSEGKIKVYRDGKTVYQMENL